MKILFLGDICPTNDYKRLFDDTSGNSLFKNKNTLINNVDYVVCNLECPATSSTSAIKKCGPSLKAEPQHLETLKNVGVNAVSLANNHILDYDVTGLNDTILGCNEHNIDYFGVSVNGNLDKDKLVIKNNDEIVTVFSFSEREFNYENNDNTGAIHFDPYDSFDKIKDAKKIGKVVVLYHGGIEYYRYPSPLLRKKCLKMAEAGADVVLCQHSHLIGSMENYKNSFILYGQGNTVFGYRKNSTTWNNGLAVYYDTNKGVTLDVTIAKEDGIYTAEESFKQYILEDLKNISNNINNEFINNEWESFCNKKKDLYYPMLFGKNRIFNKLNRLFKGKLINLFINKKKKMTTMNLIRCDAHNEVIETLLEKDYK